MISCIQNVKKDDIIIFGYHSGRYLALDKYINNVPPGFNSFLPGYIPVRDIEAQENTMLVGPDMGRINKIIKAKCITV